MGTVMSAMMMGAMAIGGTKMGAINDAIICYEKGGDEDVQVP